MWQQTQQNISLAIGALGFEATLIKVTKSGASLFSQSTSTQDYPIMIVDTNQELASVSPDQQLVASQGRVIYLDASSLPEGIEPSSSDRIRIGSVEHSIVEIARHSPGGIVLYYEIQIAG